METLPKNVADYRLLMTYDPDNRGGSTKGSDENIRFDMARCYVGPRILQMTLTHFTDRIQLQFMNKLIFLKATS